MWGHNVNELQKLQTSEGKCECYFMGGWQLKKVYKKKESRNNTEARLGLCWFYDDKHWHPFNVSFLSSHSFLCSKEACFPPPQRYQSVKLGEVVFEHHHELPNETNTILLLFSFAIKSRSGQLMSARRALSLQTPADMLSLQATAITTLRRMSPQLSFLCNQTLTLTINNISNTLYNFTLSVLFGGSSTSSDIS